MKAKKVWMLVEVREVWVQPKLVQVIDTGTAHKKVESAKVAIRMGKGTDVDNALDYSFTMQSDKWTAEPASPSLVRKMGLDKEDV